MKNTKRIISITLTLIAIVAAIGAISWRLQDNKETLKAQAELTQERNTFVPVTIGKVEKKSFRNDFTVNGDFQPTQQITVISDVNGRITSLKIKDGAYVQQGQVILAVDNRLLNNELKVTKLNLQKAEKDLARMSNLLKDGGVTELQFEEAKLGVDNLKVQIESLEKRIEDTYVKAPINGMINNKRVEDGSYLAPGTPIANIVNVNPIRLDVFLTEDQIVTVKPGQKVKITAEVLPGKEFQGTVTFVDVQADNTKRFPVQIQLANANALKAGMSGQALFATSAPVAALAIPRAAFDGSILEGKVYVVKDNHATVRKVKAGNTFGDYVEVLDGLQSGEAIVLTGQINLSDGAEVKVIE